MGIKIVLSGSQTGLTDVFACVHKDDAGTMKVHKGSDTWEIWAIANLDTYDIPLSEIGDSGIYEADFPSLAAGRYIVKFYRGTPSTQTITVYYPDAGIMDWNGTEEVFVINNIGRVDVGNIEGVGATSQIGDAVWDEQMAGHIANDSAGARQKFINDVLEGDVEVDTTITPWQLVVKIKSTSTELIRKDLKDVTGANLTSINTIIGQQKEPQ